MTHSIQEQDSRTEQVVIEQIGCKGNPYSMTINMQALM